MGGRRLPPAALGGAAFALPQAVMAGRVVRRTFRVFLSNLAPFLALSAVVSTPFILYSAYVLATVDVRTDGNVFLMAQSLDRLSDCRLGSVGLLLVLLLTPVASGAVTFGVLRQLSGNRAGLGECLVSGFRHLLPALGVGLLTGAAVMGGSILLLVPGIIAFCGLYAAVPIQVVQRLGVAEALRRSWTLTRGAWGPIFALMFIDVAGYVIGFILKAIFVSLPAELTSVNDIHISVTPYVVGLVIVEIVTIALQATAMAVVYQDLRVTKEGSTAADLAAAI